MRHIVFFVESSFRVEPVQNPVSTGNAARSCSKRNETEREYGSSGTRYIIIRVSISIYFQYRNVFYRKVITTEKL